MISGKNWSAIADYNYTVAASGHRLTAAEAIATTNTIREVNRAYGYDSLYRLTGEDLTAAGVTNLPPSASVAYTHVNLIDHPLPICQTPSIMLHYALGILIANRIPNAARNLELR